MSAALRSIDLVESDEHVGAPGPVAAAPSPPWLRRHVRAAVAVAAAVVVVAVGLQGVSDARERAQVAALASVPGIVRPLSSDLRVAWRLPAEQASAVWSAPAQGVVVAGSSGQEGFRLIGRDEATGAVLWTTPVVPTPGPGAWTWCLPVARAGGDVTVCTAGSNSGLWEVTGPDRHLWVLEPRTGEVLAERTLPMTAQLAAHGGDLLVAQPADDDRWRLDATDPVTGASRWTFTTDPVTSTSTLMLDTPQLVDVDDGVLLVVPGHMWSIGTDGRLRTEVSNDGAWWTGLRGGALLGFRQDGTGTGGYRSTVVLADGTRLPGADRDLDVSPDDGSAADVVVTAGAAAGAGQVVARSADDGHVLWTAAGSPNTAMVLRDRLYLGSSDAIEARDPHTGRVIWHRTLDHRAQQLATDGRSLLVTRDSSVVDAYALADGEPRWSADVADVAGIGASVVSLGFYGRTGHLLASLEDGTVVALR